MYLSVGDGHEIYYEEHGTPTGHPVIVLHGGPGGGLSRSVLQFFDLTLWRVLLYDQRGCGRSRPFLSTRANTTWHLVADIEVLREKMGADKIYLFGGSWGTTLALAYASLHANRVLGMVLRGVCLMEPWEMEWLYGENGVARMFPREWAAFAITKNTTRGRLLKYRNLLRQKKTRKKAAAAWWKYEASLSHLQPRKDTTSTKQRAVVNMSDSEYSTKQTEALAVLENHYFIHNAWIHKNQLLRAATRMHFPVHIVQGSYDLICPASSAVALAAALPSATLNLTHAGHAASESAKALKAAVKKILAD